MAQLGLLLWALFIIFLGFSMMPGYITFVIVVSFCGGILDGWMKTKKKQKKANFKLTNQEKTF